MCKCSTTNLPISKREFIQLISYLGGTQDKIDCWYFSKFFFIYIIFIKSSCSKIILESNKIKAYIS